MEHFKIFLKQRFQLQDVIDFVPEIVFLQIGSNDLCDPVANFVWASLSGPYQFLPIYGAYFRPDLSHDCSILKSLIALC